MRTMQHLLAAAIISLGTVSDAMAQDWMEAETRNGTRTDVDAESVEILAENRISLSWRTFLAATNTYFLHRGILNCDKFSLLSESIEYLVLEASGRGYRSQPVDLKRGSNSSSEMAAILQFPAYGGEWNRKLRALCRIRVEDWDQGRQQRFPEMSTQSCKAGDDRVSIYCDPRSDVQGALVNMRIRRLQHQQVCSPTGNEIVIAEFPILEAKCQEEACRVETIDRASRLYEEDLIAQGFDKPCTAVARNFRMVAEEARKKEEFAKYGSCVKRLVNSLDDQKSGADVIAQGLHSTCKDALSSNVSLSDDLKLNLIQIVLEARYSRRKK